MTKLWKVERKVEDYPGKFDIDIYIVGADDNAKAISACQDRNGFCAENEAVRYKATAMLDIAGAKQVEVDCKCVCYIGTRVLDTNKEDLVTG